MTNDSIESISDGDIEFLVNLQNEWTEVIVGRMIATNEIEQLEAAKQEQTLHELKAVCSMLLNLHKKLGVYKLTLENDLTLTIESQNKIVQGLLDTITLKDQAVLEQVEYIKEELIIKYKLEVADVVNKAYDRLLVLKEESELQNIDNLIEKIVLEARNELNNSNMQIQKDLEDYISNYILFEIITFEDLKKYSIPVLNNNLATVKEFKKLDKNILKELQKIGIQIINPNEHDKFNSKLHEILLADSKEEFEKGEVIEVLNRGYEYNNKILRRATIVASK
ncbi:MAG: grpE [Clostridiales bacterium]|jgi:molecular chaperone GrpE|nr:grpE [Clostridiales bacterium]